MEDSIIDSFRYAMKSHSEKTNGSGRSILSTSIGKKKARKMKGTTTDYPYVVPETFNTVWDAEIYRLWEGRADEFWSARMQPKIKWEYSKTVHLETTDCDRNGL